MDDEPRKKGGAKGLSAQTTNRMTLDSLSHRRDGRRESQQQLLLPRDYKPMMMTTNSNEDE